ncbi:MAG: TCR/Tet family MFS transporter [Gammaproteobacteria bacterium AqS3]|nr:TCR/Tet family MFS transporter [Gammaproteobacteria bacterium AqS3]
MPNRRHTIAFILVTIALDSMSLGIVIPVLVNLLRELTDLEPKDSVVYGSALLFIVAAMQFIFAPILGNLSDRFGRRPVLLLSLAALAVDHLLVAIAPTIYLVFLARLLTGICTATFPTANAVIADITPPDERVRLFGIIGGAWGVGFILGPLLGGFIGAEFGTRAPFYVAAVLAGLNALYGALVMPETLGEEHRRPFSWARANPVGSIWQMRKFPMLLPMFAAVFFYMVAHDVNPGVWVFYVTHKFGWGPTDISHSLVAVGVCTILVMTFLVGYINDKLGEYRTAYLGFAFGALGYLGIGLATEGWMMYAMIPVFSLFGVGMPAVRGLMSAKAGPDAQGDLQGSIGSVSALATVLTPLAIGPLFTTFSQPDFDYYFPGVVHIMGAAALVVAAVFVGFSALMHRREREGGDGGGGTAG